MTSVPTGSPSSELRGPGVALSGTDHHVSTDGPVIGPDLVGVDGNCCGAFGDADPVRCEMIGEPPHQFGWVKGSPMGEEDPAADPTCQHVVLRLARVEESKIVLGQADRACVADLLALSLRLRGVACHSCPTALVVVAVDAGRVRDPPDLVDRVEDGAALADCFRM